MRFSSSSSSIVISGPLLLLCVAASSPAVKAEPIVLAEAVPQPGTGECGPRTPEFCNSKTIDKNDRGTVDAAKKLESPTGKNIFETDKPFILERPDGKRILIQPLDR